MKDVFQIYILQPIVCFVYNISNKCNTLDLNCLKKFEEKILQKYKLKFINGAVNKLFICTFWIEYIKSPFLRTFLKFLNWFLKNTTENNWVWEIYSINDLSDSANFVYFLKFLQSQEKNCKIREEMAVDAVKEKALADYRAKLMEHKEVDARLKNMREELKGLTKQYDK